MSSIIIFLSSVFTLSLLFKIIEIGRAVIWIKSKGREYSEYILNNYSEYSEIDRDSYYEIFQKFGGDFFPFGVKDYKIYSLIEKLQRSSTLKKFLGLLIQQWHHWFFKYYILSPLVVVYIFLLVPKIDFIIPLEASFFFSNFLFLMALSCLIINLLIEIEIAFGHIFLRDYGVYFHMLSPKRTPMTGGSKVILEMEILIISLFIIIVSSAATVYLSYVRFDAFEGEHLIVYNSSTNLINS